MSKKGVGSEKTQADVCGLGEFPQGVGESKVFCTWPTIYQGHHNLKGPPHTHIEKKSPFSKGFPGGASGKEPACQCRRYKTQVLYLGREDPPEEESMAAHSSISAWRIPWTEELGELQSVGSLRVGQD